MHIWLYLRSMAFYGACVVFPSSWERFMLSGVRPASVRRWLRDRRRGVTHCLPGRTGGGKRRGSSGGVVTFPVFPKLKNPAHVEREFCVWGLCWVCGASWHQRLNLCRVIVILTLSVLMVVVLP